MTLDFHTMKTESLGMGERGLEMGLHEAKVLKSTS